VIYVGQSLRTDQGALGTGARGQDSLTESSGLLKRRPNEESV